MKTGLPFAHLNLRWNPFGERPLEDWPALAELDVAALAERLRQPPFVAQFLGEAGRGKTTHLLALRACFPDAPYVHLPETGPRPAVPRGPVVFVDETQRLSAWARRRLWRSAGAVIVGTHEDHSEELRRLRVPFTSIVLRGLDEERLGRIVTRRIEAARRAEGPVPRITEAALARLIAAHGDDVRAILHRCYEAVQSMGEPGDVPL